MLPIGDGGDLRDAPASGEPLGLIARYRITAETDKSSPQ
jgi:hypothetical protein